MKMEKRKFRIGELAKALSQNGTTIETSVIRFWEREFHRASARSSKGQRFYTEDDYCFFSKIRELLYEKKFTIQGAKKALSQKTKTLSHNSVTQADLLHDKLHILRLHLLKIRELL